LLTDPSGAQRSVIVDAGGGEMVFSIEPSKLPTPEGTYTMTVSSTGSEPPTNWWEIYWRTEVVGSDSVSTGEFYEGTFASSLTWTYLCGSNSDEERVLAAVADNDLWTLVAAEGLIETGAAACQECSGKKCDKKRQSGRKSKRSPKRNRGDRDVKSDQGTDLSVEMFSEDSCGGKGKSKNGPKCKGKKSKRLCDGWADASPIGAQWFISDDSGMDLIDSGSLCDGCSGSCGVCLDDGSYVFRVTGAYTNETEDAAFEAWEFCHSRGSFNNELSFHVKKGKCHPDVLLWASELGSDETRASTVLAEGVIALGGLPSEQFAAQASSVVLNVLAETVKGWSVSAMSVTATSLDVDLLANAAMGFTHDVVFTVSFDAEDYSVNGASFAEVEGLLSDMAATLEASFAANEFAAQLLQEAATMNIDALQAMTTVALVSLQVVQIEYSTNHLVYVYGYEADVQSHSGLDLYSMSTTALLFLVAVVAFGFVSLVGIARHGMSSYAQLSAVTDSERDAASAEMRVVARTPFGTNDQLYAATRSSATDSL